LSESSWTAGHAKELGLNIDLAANLESGAGVHQESAGSGIGVELQPCAAEVVGAAHQGQ